MASMATNATTHTSQSSNSAAVPMTSPNSAPRAALPSSLHDSRTVWSQCASRSSSLIIGPPPSAESNVHVLAVEHARRPAAVNRHRHQRLDDGALAVQVQAVELLVSVRADHVLEHLGALAVLHPRHNRHQLLVHPVNARL